MISYFLISCIFLLIYTLYKTKTSLHMMQQNWYDLDHRYLKWILKSKKKVFMNLDILFILFIIFIFFKIEISLILFSLFYLINIYIYKKQIKNESVKIKFNITARVKRLFITTFIIYITPITVMCFYLDSVPFAYYALVLGLLTYLNNFVIILSGLINTPIEKYIASGFKTKAKKKLNSLSNMKVVGITGSYGKTSSKIILDDVLNVKLNSFKTPKNFNTPVGLIITINNYLDKFNDIFIAEMGAFKKGEIKELCDLVNPTYGILTKVGTAHLESFGSEKNIQEGKFELIESLPEDGIGILNMDDPNQISYKLKNNCKIVWVAINNEKADVKASNIKLSYNGTSFDCTFKGDKKKYHFETSLLGKHNIYNILAAIALANELGLSKEDLVKGVKIVKPVEHRLELKKIMGMNIIDDAYNSNPEGSKMATEVLSMMPGKTIIVTPGMIELGDQEYDLNKAFGEYIADYKIDEVILVGEKQTRPILDGLKEKKYDKKKIHILNDVKEAFYLAKSLSNEETYVLLENDLPDIFNENE
jgi:UDP-N-acetylmuramyl pentapeptide synthase